MVQRLTVNRGADGTGGTLACRGCGAPVTRDGTGSAGAAMITHRKDCPEVSDADDEFPGYGLARREEDDNLIRTELRREEPGHGYQEEGDY